MMDSAALIDALVSRGVHVLAPASVVLQDIEPANFEAGVTIYPGVTIRGQRSRFGAGTELGKAGGGYFEDVVCGRDVELFGGYFKQCVFLDGVTIRGQSEVRGGTVLEEGCEAAHHVGYKMTVMLPWVVAGSLVNFCDAFVSGGRSRREHSEIGSTLALYNFTPWGDKFASLFGDVPRGVFMRQDPIFIGGQTQIVSPVKVGFGSILIAGSPIRRDVGPARLYGEQGVAVDQPFDARQYGMVSGKLRTSLEFIGNLQALRVFYREVREPAAKDDPHTLAVYAAADAELLAGIRERIKRLRAFAKRVEVSLAAHRAAVLEHATDLTFEQRHRRIEDQERFIARWPAVDAALDQALDPPATNVNDVGGLHSPYDVHALDEIAELYAVHCAALIAEVGGTTGCAGAQPVADLRLVRFLRDELAEAPMRAGEAALQGIIDHFLTQCGIEL